MHFTRIEPEDLQRLKVQGSYDPVAAALADWPPALAQLAAGAAAGCAPELHAERGLLLVSACAEQLAPLLLWLSRQRAVHWLAPHMHQRLHNVVASAITQGARPATAAGALTSEMHPLWRAGIDGTGQVVGCGDSGIDLDSCYFWDPAVNVPSGLTVDRNTGAQLFSSTSHRKVRGGRRRHRRRGRGGRDGRRAPAPGAAAAGSWQLARRRAGAVGGMAAHPNARSPRPLTSSTSHTCPPPHTHTHPRCACTWRWRTWWTILGTAPTWPARWRARLT